MFLYFLFPPNCAMSFVLFMLIALKIGVDPENNSMQLLIVYHLYGLFVGFLMIAMTIYTITTWKRAHDNIYVRGELVFQEIILSAGLLIHFIIYNIDRHEFTPENERYDSVYYFGYFLTITLMTFTSLLVSTQWLPMQIRRETRILDRSTSRRIVLDEHIEDLRKITLQSMISLPSALHFLLQHLEKENLVDHFAVQCLRSISFQELIDVSVTGSTLHPHACSLTLDVAFMTLICADEQIQIALSLMI